METKLAKLKAMWAAGDYRGALKLAASWGRLGPQKGRIQQGWAAVTNAKTYRQMGKDPEYLYNDALSAMMDRYDLPLPIIPVPYPPEVKVYDEQERRMRVHGWVFMDLTEAQHTNVKQFLATGRQADYDKINWKETK